MTLSGAGHETPASTPADATCSIRSALVSLATNLLTEVCGPHTGLDQADVIERAKIRRDMEADGDQLDWTELSDTTKAEWVVAEARALLDAWARPPLPAESSLLDHSSVFSPPYLAGQRELDYWRRKLEARVRELAGQCRRRAAENVVRGGAAAIEARKLVQYNDGEHRQAEALLWEMQDRLPAQTGHDEVAHWIVRTTDRRNALRPQQSLGSRVSEHDTNGSETVGQVMPDPDGPDLAWRGPSIARESMPVDKPVMWGRLVEALRWRDLLRRRQIQTIQPALWRYNGLALVEVLAQGGVLTAAGPGSGAEVEGRVGVVPGLLPTPELVVIAVHDEDDTEPFTDTLATWTGHPGPDIDAAVRSAVTRGLIDISGPPRDRRSGVECTPAGVRAYAELVATGRPAHPDSP